MLSDCSKDTEDGSNDSLRQSQQPYRAEYHSLAVPCSWLSVPAKALTSVMATALPHQHDVVASICIMPKLAASWRQARQPVMNNPSCSTATKDCMRRQLKPRCSSPKHQCSDQVTQRARKVRK